MHLAALCTHVQDCIGYVIPHVYILQVKAGMRLALDQFGLPKGQKIEL